MTDVSVSLEKGENISLDKVAPGLTKVAVGLGWDVRTTDGEDFDLDASAIMCGADRKVLSKNHFVFYGSELKKFDGTIPSPDGSILHTGDNLTGEGDGDDEVINVDLAAVPSNVEVIVFPCTIYKAVERKQSFGQVSNAFIRVVDVATNHEIARFDLPEDYAKETALIAAELYRKDGEWKFKAVGQGYSSGLAGIASDYGMHASGG
jgi:tellurium resistance protein TerD